MYGTFGKFLFLDFLDNLHTPTYQNNIDDKTINILRIRK